MFDLLQKTFIIEILGQECKIKQFSYLECLEFAYLLQEDDFDFNKWVYDFLRQKIRITEQDMGKIDLDKFLQVLNETVMKGFYSKSKSKSNYPLSAYLTTLSERLHIHPNKLIEKYTPEQMNFYLEGLVYNANETTKEGKRRNRINMAMKNDKYDREKELEKVKKMEERLKSGQIKFKKV